MPVYHKHMDPNSKRYGSGTGGALARWRDFVDLNKYVIIETLLLCICAWELQSVGYFLSKGENLGFFSTSCHVHLVDHPSPDFPSSGRLNIVR